jgi:hypothetical protein
MKTAALVIAAALAVTLTACGGGGSDSAPAPVAKKPTLSFYGNPLPTAPASGAVANVQVVRADVAAPASDPNAETVTTLQDALAAQGVTATVTPQLMNGTTLHALIMGEDNGLPPTNDQFVTDPSGFLVVNFTLDDMITPRSDPNQQAALVQFTQDMTTFIQRAHVAGKLVFVILPIPTCDTVTGQSAADGLIEAANQAAGAAGGFGVGTLPSNGVADANGVVTNTFTQGHLGSDCRTPDAWLLNAWTQSIATPIAAAMKQGV